MGYPLGRRSFFAQRYIRLLAKTCAAQEMSTNAFALCVIIASQEDAKRYTGPVTFYNDQLLPILGMRKWESLSRARKAAIEAGWLHYDAPPNGARAPGRYWVTIPSDVLESLPDGGCDEHPEPYPEHDDDPSNASKAYPKNGYGKGDDAPKPYPENGDGQHEPYPENGDGRGYGRGELSILCPSPNKSARSVSKAKSAKPRNYSPEFTAFWGHYPRRIAKPKAAEAFANAVARLLADPDRPDVTTESDAVAFLREQAQAFARMTSDTASQFVPYAATWLNEDRFDDALTTPTHTRPLLTKVTS